MKKNILISAIFFLVSLVSFSQNLIYNVHGAYTRAINKEKLNLAKNVADIISDYPINWIEDYVSVEVSSTNNGKTVKAVSKNDVLSKEQIDILQTADFATDVVIDVNYLCTNPATQALVTHTMHISYTVIPEIEAEYPGGFLKLKEYLREKCVDKISESLAKYVKSVIIRFNIDEQGDAVDARILQTSGYDKIDKLLLHVIHKMPKWSAAQDVNGNKIKQEFELNIGVMRIGDGC